MSTPERMMAIRRLFLAKLEKMPSDMQHNDRVEMARKELDKSLGPIWRMEVEQAGVELDPTGDMLERMDKLPEATKEEGFQGDDIPQMTLKKKPKKEQSIVHTFMKIFHGK